MFSTAALARYPEPYQDHRLNSTRQIEVEPASLNILMVEDSASDALLTRIALDATRIPHQLGRLKDGREVMPYLSKCQQKGHRMPDVIMLDLGLPGVDGFEILAALSTSAHELRGIPIIILTGYEHFEYLKKVYQLPILAYIAKPCNMQEIRAVLKRVQQYRLH